MRRHARVLLFAGALVLLPLPALLPAFIPAFLPALGGGGCVAAAAGAKHAALVVGTGSRTIDLCVALDADQVSGIHLIELAHAQDGLEYSLGFGGQAVCQLAGVGPAGSDCWADYPSFWGLWIGDGNGGWTWSSSGAGSVSIHDGGVEGWTWGAGSNGSTHPVPPPTTFGSVCGSGTPSPSVAPTPTPKTPKPSPSRGGPPSAGVREGLTPTSTPRGSRSPTEGPSGGGAPNDSTASVLPGGETLAAGAGGEGSSGSGGGPPAGAVLALAGVLGLAGAGWLRARSRSRDPQAGDGR